MWYLTVWERASLQQTIDMSVSGRAGVYGPREGAVRVFPQDGRDATASAAGWTALADQLDITWATPPKIPSGDYGPTMWSYAAGWPTLAVCGNWSSPPRHPPRQFGSWGRGLWNAGDGRTLLPYLPIWPGFLLNTLFYVAPWWLILTTASWAARRAKRRRHHRRGRCTNCGYDLTGLTVDEGNPVCPECGE